MSSNYVCLRCGVAVGLWGKRNSDETYWKHHNGGYKGPRSCGRKPIPVRKAEYEKKNRI